MPNRKVLLYRHRRTRTAIHEAGHAFVAWIEGVRFTSVTIKRSDDVNGLIFALGYRKDDDNIIRVVLAGIIAARMIRKTWGEKLFESAHEDLGIAAGLLRELGIPNEAVDSQIRSKAQETHGLLERGWAVVERIAVQLLTHNELKWESVDEIARKPKITVPYPGRLGRDGWQPLVDAIGYRFRFPRGPVDAVAAIMQNNARFTTETS